MAPSNPTATVNIVVLATIVGVVTLVVNTVFLPILWSEITSTWTEFDDEIHGIKDMCDGLWGDIARLSVKPPREKRESVRRNLEAQQTSDREEEEYQGEEGQEQVEDYQAVRRAPVRETSMAEDSEDDSASVRCDCKPEVCPKGPRGAKGLPGEPGIPGEHGPNGIPGKDASTTAALLADQRHCARCPAGPEGPPGPQGGTGVRGMRGPEGKPGCFGKNGPPGHPGEMGAPGQMGPPGPAGPRGAAGQPGRFATGGKGPKGPPGTPGKPGTIGDRGDDGSIGSPGIAGPKGSPGKNGTPGGSGESGVAGLPGRRGPDGEYCTCPKLPTAKPPSTEPEPPAPSPAREGLIPFKNSGAYPAPKPFKTSGKITPVAPVGSAYDEPTTTPVGVKPSGYEVEDKTLDHVANLMEEQDNAAMVDKTDGATSEVEVTPAEMPTSAPGFVPPHHEPKSISKDGYEIYTGLREEKHSSSKEVALGEDKLPLSTPKPTVGMFRTIQPKVALTPVKSAEVVPEDEQRQEGSSLRSPPEGAISKAVFRKSFRKLGRSHHRPNVEVSTTKGTSPLPIFIPIRLPKVGPIRAVNAKTAAMKPTLVANGEIPADIFSVHS